ncbi:MAG: NAD(P)-binding domain-containing protein, partial [Mycobacterium sp.]|nr:NAD(P)-binding domain-containing protein [Mycobacterium sp.]
MKIGFIGIGNMGLPMALNLAKGPNEVTGFDTVATVPDPLAKADTARAAVRDADVVITMLPNGDILNRVYDDILPGMPAGALMIDCSTVDVAEARQAAAKAIERGMRAVDAPVSGGVQGAKDATLTFMVGADT